MATIVTRAGKGSALTYAEADANFTNLNTDKIETSEIGVTVQPFDSNLESFLTVFELPTADSTAGYVISTDGAGNLNFIAQGGGVTSVTATSPVTSTGGATPVIAMPAATTSVSGYLTSTDWNTFNNKGAGTVTSVTGTSPVVSSGGATPAISMAAATTSVNGYLTSTDWTTFNSKAPATSGTSILYGNGSGGFSNVTIGTNLTFSGGTLDATGGGGGLTGFTSAYNTSAPNATVTVSSLSATGAATDIDVAIVPKGLGSILAAIPDSTATGGDKRGTYAVDLQTKRTLSTQVASGNYSVVSGGESNIASGAWSVIAGGSNNTASAEGATVGGGGYNEASGFYSVIAGGGGNDPGDVNTASGNYSFIGGGYANIASSTTTVVCGGSSNTASGDTSFVGGGYSNTSSGDWSVIAGGEINTANSFNSSVGGGLYNTASGDYSVVSGGGYNTASGNTSYVGGGDNNTASGDWSSIVGGKEATTRGLYGANTRGNGAFNNLGDAQIGSYIARRQTTTATATVLTFDQSAAGTTNQVVLPNDSTYFFTISISARRTNADNESAAYKFEGCIDRNTNAASTALVGVPVKTILAEDTTAWDVSVTADTTNGALAITVTGEASKTIRWVAHIQTVEVVG
jgi:hypothetical protein